jgi:hypothetical protein
MTGFYSLMFLEHRINLKPQALSNMLENPDVVMKHVGKSRNILIYFTFDIICPNKNVTYNVGEMENLNLIERSGRLGLTPASYSLGPRFILGSELRYPN